MNRSVAALVGSLVVLFTACTSAPSSSPGASASGASGGVSGEPVAVGAICVFTGAINPDTGKSVERGLAIATDEINAQGGINGRPIKVISEDYAGTPATAVDAVHKLIDVDKVSTILFCTNSGALLALAPYAQSKNVVILNTASSTPDIRNFKDTIFSPVPLDDVMGRLLGEWMAERGVKTMATLVQNQPYGLGIQKTVVPAFTSKGGKLLGNFAYEPTKNDYRTELQQVLNLKPEAIVVTPFATDGKLLFKQGKELGFSGDWYLCYPSVNFVSDPNDANGHMYGINVGFNIPEAAKFNAEYQRRYNVAPNQPWAATTYDALWLTARAMRLGGTTADAVRANLRKATDGYTGASGKITFDADGQRTDMAVDRFVYQDGKLIAAK